MENVNRKAPIPIHILIPIPIPTYNYRFEPFERVVKRFSTQPVFTVKLDESMRRIEPRQLNRKDNGRTINPSFNFVFPAATPNAVVCIIIRQWFDRFHIGGWVRNYEQSINISVLYRVLPYPISYLAKNKVDQCTKNRY